MDKLPAMKILVSVGTDYRFKENGASEDKLTCIKMWDFESLISDSYSEYKKYEYTGGSIWDRQQTQEPNIYLAPKMIVIYGKNDKPYQDAVGAIRVSPDGVYIAVVLLKDAEIKVWQLVQKNTD